MASAMEVCGSNACDNYAKIKALIEEAELRAINRHKYYLSQQQGEDIGFQVAAADWFTNYSEAWHQKRHSKMLEMQREEIKRFKWIESEREQRDLGRSAVEDWIHKHAAEWRVNWEQSYDDDNDSY
jgi:hypothetical protein